MGEDLSIKGIPQYVGRHRASILQGDSQDSKIFPNLEWRDFKLKSSTYALHSMQAMDMTEPQGIRASELLVRTYVKAP